MTIFISLLFVALVISVFNLIVVTNNHKLLIFQLYYVRFYVPSVYRAYRKFKKEGFVYYSDFESWYESGDYHKGNQISLLPSGYGAWVDEDIVFSGFYNKLFEDLLGEEYDPEKNTKGLW